MTKQIQLEELYNSKTYVRESGGFDFRPAREYVEPFVQKIGTTIPGATFNVTAVTGGVNKEEDSEILNVSYGRFLVEAELPEAYDVCESISKIGLIVGLDTQKPILKTYSGKDVRACMNLTIFNASNLYQQDLLSGVSPVWDKADEYAQRVGDELQQYENRVKQLQEMHFTGKDLDEIIGKLLRFSLRQPRLGQTPILSGTKDLLDTKSKYALVNGGTSGWNYYNAITEAIKKADITDRAVKTILLSKAFGVDKDKAETTTISLN